MLAQDDLVGCIPAGINPARPYRVARLNHLSRQAKDVRVSVAKMLCSAQRGDGNLPLREEPTSGGGTHRVSGPGFAAYPGLGPQRFRYCSDRGQAACVPCVDQLDRRNGGHRHEDSAPDSGSLDGVGERAIDDGLVAVGRGPLARLRRQAAVRGRAPAVGRRCGPVCVGAVTILGSLKSQVATRFERRLGHDGRLGACPGSQLPQNGVRVSRVGDLIQRRRDGVNGIGHTIALIGYRGTLIGGPMLARRAVTQQL